MSLVAVALVPASASAQVNTADTVAGTNLGTLSLAVGTGAVFAPTEFVPGKNPATATGALVATSTNPSWALSVKDVTTGEGHTAGRMRAVGVTCDGSAPELSNPLSVQVASALGGVTSAGEKTIGATDVQVANAASQLLAASALTTTYRVVIPATEILRTGCLYNLTAQYTLQ